MDGASLEDRFAGLVMMSVTAARSLERAMLSLDPAHQRASKELAAFLLGVFRTLEHLDAGSLQAWRAAVGAALGRDVLELCRSTGEPAFLGEGFLAFLRAGKDSLTPPPA